MSLARALAGGPEARAIGGDWDRYTKALLAQMRTTSGITVSPESAMKIAVFFDCVRILAEDTAKLPLFVYHRLRGGGKEKATDHPVFKLLHNKPNPYNTSMELRETVVGHMVSRGNGYLYKRMKGGIYPESLWPLRPDRITYLELPKLIDPDEEVNPFEDTDNIRFYEYMMADGQVRNIPARDIIHLRGFGFTGRKGYSPAIQGRESVGLAAAAERYAAAFFLNDATPRTILKHKKTFKTDTAAEAIRKSWEERMRGLDKSHLVAILEDDMDVETIGLNAEEAQLLATREFSAEDVARWFRMPPHKIGALRKATYSNIEHQALEYVVDTLTPWLIRVEQRLTLELLTDDDLGEYFIEHLIAGLLRGDFEARMKGYRVGREIGMYSVNDLLEMDNRNPIGPEGDIRHVPLNWVKLDDGEPEPEPEPTPPEDQQAADLTRQLEARRQAGQDRAGQMRLRLRERYAPLFRQAADAVTARELADVDRAVKRYLKKEDVDGLRDWVTDFYGRHVAFVRDKLAPVVDSYAAAVADLVDDHLGEDTVDRDQLAAFAHSYVAGERGRAGYYAGKGAAAVLAILDLLDLLEELEVNQSDIHLRLVALRTQRTDQISDIEPVRAGEALAHEAYTHAGVTTWRWRSGGQECPYADLLDGTTTETGQPFLTAGQRLVADGTSPLEPSSDINHAPAHRGCTCYTEPVFGGDL